MQKKGQKLEEGMIYRKSDSTPVQYSRLRSILPVHLTYFSLTVLAN